jgi:hypothetical protein
MADSCWYYYGGSASAHDEGVALAGIGVATFTPGRLVGQQVEGEGWCCGLPFRCPGGTLELDALARHPLVVSVRAAGYGGPLPGYTSEECLAVTGDSQAHAVRWKTQASLDALSGRFVQLCVQGQDSVVYGFRLRR